MRFRRFRLRKQRDEDLTAGLLMRSPPASRIHIRVTGASVRLRFVDSDRSRSPARVPQSPWACRRHVGEVNRNRISPASQSN